MKAFVLEDFDAEPRLREDLPDPEPGEGELVVRVQASSVNPVDTGVVAGSLRDYADYEFPVILGRDLAGVMKSAGSGAAFAEGDEVFGFVPAVGANVHNGA
jgi:NADPH:quinone reductase